MDKIIIRGGNRLHGKVLVSGAKNAALPLICAALLAPGRHRFHNVPSLRDIDTIENLLASLGAQISRGDDLFEIDTTAVDRFEAPYDMVRKMRASVLVLGPLLARFGRARVSLPGGCAIGARPINLHIKGLEAMGAEIELDHGYLNAQAKKLKGARIHLALPPGGGPENLMMAAALAQGTTVLENAACEPEIVDLARALKSMGAHIEGEGTDTLVIEGVPDLGTLDYRVMPDRIEAGTLMVAAAMTGGDVRIQGMIPQHLKSLIGKLQDAGTEITYEAETVRVRRPRRIEAVDILTLPYPGFPTDMQAQFMALMTLAKGASVITENVFENRFMHVCEMQRLGADITIDGNTAIIKGVKKLLGAPVMATDLRASASLVLCGLAAENTTEVKRIYHLDRGYERLEEKLRRLGADIVRVPE